MHPDIWKQLRLLFLAITGIVTGLILQITMEAVLIPDPCYYHARDTTKLFQLFYKLESSEGYHPTPTLLNTISMQVSGILLVLLLRHAWYRFLRALGE